MGVSLDWRNRVIFNCFLHGEGKMLKEESVNAANTELHQRSTVLIDKEAWDVIKMQAKSLERKDNQMDELIQLLKNNREKTFTAGAV